jgi:hypothetical protein
VAHLRGILELEATYPVDELERAFDLGHAYNTFSYHFVRGLVEQAPPACPAREPPAEACASLRPVPVIAVQGDLATYQRLLAAGRRWS